MLKRTLLTATVALAAIAAASAAQARDQIRIVGSSTVYPFTTAVAEQFGKSAGKTPVVESTGTGGGMKLFCAGVGADHPDLSNASRSIKKSEFEMCQNNGVTDIIEIKVGFDGITFSHSKGASDVTLSKQQIFLALAKEVPGADGKMVPNPNKLWSDIDASLPANKIEVLGPPPTSGTRDAFVELVMRPGAESFDSLKALAKDDKNAFRKISDTMREDGGFVEAGENDNLIVQKLQANPDAFGIFGYSFLEENQDKIKGAAVEGVKPSFDAIASGEYKVSRPLFVYAKKQHVGVIPGMQEFMDEFVSENAMGEDGYLPAKGLIPLPEEELTKVRDAVRNGTGLAM